MATRREHPSFNPFAVGAVVLDSTPYVNYSLRKEAEAKAKEESLNKYFQDMDATISPTGMDVENDFPALEVMRNNWRKYGLENKEAIHSKKDGGKAYVEFMRMFGDMKGYIEQSKQKVGQIKEYNDFRMKNPESIIDDEFIANIDKSRQPIRKVVPDGLGNKHVIENHDWEPIDFTEFQPVKPLTLEEMRRETKSYSQGLKPGISIESWKRNPRDANRDIVTKVTALDPKQLQIVGSTAGGRYDANRALRLSVNQYKPSPEEYALWDDAYKSVYGSASGIGNDDKKIYVAKSIFESMGETVDEQDVINDGRKTASSRSSSGGSSSGTNVINDLYSRIETELDRFINYGEKKPPLKLVADADGVSVILDMVNKGRKADDQYNVESLTVRKSDTGKMVIYKGDEYIATIPKVGTNIKVQPGVKEKRDVIAGSPPPAPSKPTKPTGDWRNRAKPVNQ